MKIFINGKQRDTDTTTLLDLLHEMEINPQLVMVEVNEDIIERGRYGRLILGENDRIELIRFIGGG